MGAYDNPNVNVGVDKTSGRMIGQAIAGVGQSIGKAITDSAKINAKGLEKYNKMLEANNVIDNTVDEIITKETIAQDQSIEAKGLKGANSDSLKESMSIRLKDYGDALKRNKKNFRRKSYDGKDDDLKTIQNFEIFSKELPSILENVNGYFGMATEAYANGTAAGDTNPFFKATTYIGNKTLAGELNYNISNNPDTGRLELNMDATGESIREINRTEAGYLGDTPMYGEMDSSGSPVFSDKYSINLTNAAKEFSDPTNPYNSPLLSTTANVDNLILDVYNTNTNDPNNTTGANTPFSEGSKIKNEYLSPPVRVYKSDPNRKGKKVTGETVFNQIQSLNPIAQNAVDQQYHNLSTLKGGNVTLTNSIMSEVKNGSIIKKDGKFFYQAFVGEDNNLITESKNLRDNNGNISMEMSLVELKIPELNNDARGNQIFTPESEESIKKWMKSRALELAGAYQPPTLLPGTNFEQYDGGEIEENKSTTYNDLLAKVYSVDGGSLTKDQVTDIFATSSPDGALIMTYEEFVKDINDSPKDSDFTEEDAKAKIAGLNKNDIFITQGDKEPVAFRKSKNGTYDKNIVATTIRNLFTGEAEQGKADKAIKIESDKNIKEINEKIATAKADIEKAIRQKTPAAQIKAEKRLTALQAQLKQIK